MNQLFELQKRTLHKKTAHLRKEGWIPGVIFEGSKESIPVQIQEWKLRKMLLGPTQRLDLMYEGKKILAAVEEIQFDHLGDKLFHISFHALNAKEKAHFKIPVSFHGKSRGELDGGVLHRPLSSISVHAYPHDLPEKISIDCSGLEMDQTWHLSDIVAQHPKLEFHPHDLDKVLVSCHLAKVHYIEPVVEKPVVEVEVPVERTEEKKAA